MPNNQLDPSDPSLRVQLRLFQDFEASRHTALFDELQRKMPGRDRRETTDECQQRKLRAKKRIGRQWKITEEEFDSFFGDDITEKMLLKLETLHAILWEDAKMLLKEAQKERRTRKRTYSRVSATALWSSVDFTRALELYHESDNDTIAVATSPGVTSHVTSTSPVASMSPVTSTSPATATSPSAKIPTITTSPAVKRPAATTHVEPVTGPRKRSRTKSPSSLPNETPSKRQGSDMRQQSAECCPPEYRNGDWEEGAWLRGSTVDGVLRSLQDLDLDLVVLEPDCAKDLPKNKRAMLPLCVKKHWVTGWVDCKGSDIWAYDSKPSLNLGALITEHLGRLRREGAWEPTRVKLMPSPVQHNTSDCGVFMLASFFFLVSGISMRNPIEGSVWRKMLEHFEQELSPAEQSDVNKMLLGETLDVAGDACEADDRFDPLQGIVVAFEPTEAEEVDLGGALAKIQRFLASLASTSIPVRGIRETLQDALLVFAKLEKMGLGSVATINDDEAARGRAARAAMRCRRLRLFTEKHLKSVSDFDKRIYNALGCLSG